MARLKRKPDDDIVASTRDATGRTVYLREKWWAHILRQRAKDLEGREGALMRALERADVRWDGNSPGREVVCTEGLGPARWLAVVVEYDGPVGHVITAYPLSKLPKR